MNFYEFSKKIRQNIIQDKFFWQMKCCLVVFVLQVTDHIFTY